MRTLSLIIGLLAIVFISATLATDSPHGKSFNVPCDQCHSAKGWQLDKTIYSFDHNTTALPLAGQHQVTDCRQCHISLVFSEAKKECFECHTDIHEQTVGPDCGRCHTPASWIIDNITEIHRLTRFPLLGPHYTTDCSECHISASLLRFQPIGVECVDCHQEDYNSTTNPSHTEGNFSTNCLDCHAFNSFTWTGSGFDHSFFPLTQAHAIGNCQACHTNGNYTGLSAECASCHLDNYNGAANPPHASNNFPTACNECHTTNPGWKPAIFNNHSQYYVLEGAHALIASDCFACHQNDYTSTPNTCVGCHLEEYNQTVNPPHVSAQFSTECNSCHSQSAWIPATFDHDNQFFPIYSGKHLGTWQTCADCHTNPGSLVTFSCIDCHEHNQPDTDEEHKEVSGYLYTSEACFACHPTGDAEGSFNHATSNFPLTGAHTIVVCSDCHTSGYAGTPTNCDACHINAFNQTTNPNHNSLSIPQTCATCHSTEPGWKPATFDIHNNYYVLEGAHASIANNCSTCHNGNYNSTPNTCVGCHLDDYNQTQNPPHASAQFSTECLTCHNQNAWIPSTFDHDGQYFPIYSGKHQGEWNVCTDCHTNPGNYTLFSCIDCHEHNKPDMDDEHSGVTGYAYNSIACFTCHPDGTSGGKILKAPQINKIPR